MALMNEAEASIKADPGSASALQTISMGYNMARLQEATGARDMVTAACGMPIVWFVDCQHGLQHGTAAGGLGAHCAECA